MNAAGGCAYLFGKLGEAAIVGLWAYAWAKNHEPLSFAFMVGLALLSITTTIAAGAMKR